MGPSEWIALGCLILTVLGSAWAIAWRLGGMAVAIKALEQRIDQMCEQHESRLFAVEERVSSLELDG